MTPSVDSSAALEWVLAKLSGAKKGTQAPVFKPPEFKPPKPAAPAFKSTMPALLQPGAMEAQKAKQLTAKRETELDLWKKWKHEGQKAEDFEALLKSHTPLLEKRLRSFGGVEVNNAAMKSVLIEHYRRALDKFNPDHSGGAQLHSWVTTNLKGLKRFVVKHQITPVRTAEAELTQRLGYAPSIQQIVDHTHTKDWSGRVLSTKDVLQVQKLVKRGLDLGGGGEEVEGAGMRVNDPFVQAAHVVYHQLKPHEQKVSELMFPRSSGQAPVYKSGVIAKKLGWEVSKVSKAKKSIFDKIQERVRD
jgi:hypothetical protein